MDLTRRDKMEKKQLQVTTEEIQKYLEKNDENKGKIGNNRGTKSKC